MSSRRTPLVLVALVATTLLSAPSVQAAQGTKPSHLTPRTYGRPLATSVAVPTAAGDRRVTAPGDLVIDDSGAGTLVDYHPADSTYTDLASGLSNSYGVARDVDGNLYATDSGANFVDGSVVEFPADGGDPITLVQDLNSANGVVVDDTGNVFVAEYGAANLVEVPADGGAPVVTALGHQVAGLAFGPDGTLYGASTDGEVLEIPTNGDAPVEVATGLGFSTGLAVAPDGSFFVTDFFGNSLNHVSADGSTVTPVVPAGSLSEPHRVSLDGSGNLFVVEAGSGDVLEIPADDSGPTVVASGFTSPLDVIVVDESQPTITATLTSRAPMTHFGWFRRNVTISYTCDAGDSTLVGSCPPSDRVSNEGEGITVERTIATADGDTASVTTVVNLDKVKPALRATHVRDGATYRRMPQVGCEAADGLSGLVRCQAFQHVVRDGDAFRYRVRARDKAGNRTVARGLAYLR